MRFTVLSMQAIVHLSAHRRIRDQSREYDEQ
jgi:hypothetical protein